jgi:hypothetical protein
MRCSITEAGALADVSTGFATSGSERWATERCRIYYRLHLGIERWCRM